MTIISYFQIIDGEKYYDEKLLKLIVVDEFEHVQSVMKHSDYLGLHLNNRLGYLQYQNIRTRQSSALDQSNKYLLLIIFSILTIILIAITLLFVSLIRRKTFQEKKEIVNTIPKTNLHVTNCCDLNDSSLLILNKDLFNGGNLLNDNCCLLETISEKEIYDQQKNQVGDVWDIRMDVMGCLGLCIVGIVDTSGYIDISFFESYTLGLYCIDCLTCDEGFFRYTC